MYFVHIIFKKSKNEGNRNLYKNISNLLEAIGGIWDILIPFLRSNNRELIRLFLEFE